MDNSEFQDSFDYGSFEADEFLLSLNQDDGCGEPWMGQDGGISMDTQLSLMSSLDPQFQFQGQLQSPSQKLDVAYTQSNMIQNGSTEFDLTQNRNQINNWPGVSSQQASNEYGQQLNAKELSLVLRKEQSITQFQQQPQEQSDHSFHQKYLKSQQQLRDTTTKLEGAISKLQDLSVKYSAVEKKNADQNNERNPWGAEVDSRIQNDCRRYLRALNAMEVVVHDATSKGLTPKEYHKLRVRDYREKLLLLQKKPDFLTRQPVELCKAALAIIHMINVSFLCLCVEEERGAARRWASLHQARLATEFRDVHMKLIKKRQALESFISQFEPSSRDTSSVMRYNPNHPAVKAVPSVQEFVDFALEIEKKSTDRLLDLVDAMRQYPPEDSTVIYAAQKLSELSPKMLRTSNMMEVYETWIRRFDFDLIVQSKELLVSLGGIVGAMNAINTSQ